MQGEGFDYLPNGIPYTGTTEAAYFYVLNHHDVYKPAYALTDISVTIQEARDYIQESPASVAADIFRGDDEFHGSKFDDHINGYRGRNELTGGRGEDHFYFTYREGSRKYDVVTDFKHNEDHIVLENSVFRQISNNNIEDKFVDVTRDEVQRGDRILYNSETGLLSYDRDGSGRLNATKIAVLEADAHGDHPALYFHDILVV